MSKGKLIFKLVFVAIFMIAIIYLRFTGAVNRSEENIVNQTEVENTVENTIENKEENSLGKINPIVEVSSKEEMEEKLGFEVPMLSKDVEKYIVIIDADRKPYHGRIIYSDNNVFEIEKTEEKDVSGIYGSEFKSKDSYNGIDAEKYTFENTEYVIWQKDGFSYSYSSEKGLALSELMSLIK